MDINQIANNFFAFKKDIDSNHEGILDSLFHPQNGLKNAEFLFRLIFENFYYIDCIAEREHENWESHEAKFCQTSKAHGYHEACLIASLILENIISNGSAKSSGSIVEMGCFTGISTSKLSIISKILGKKMFAFDSFKGLPDPDKYGTEKQKSVYKTGNYFSSLKLVSENVTKFGFDNVEYVEGFFNDTFKQFDKDFNIHACFIDVDLARSLEECLDFVIDKVESGGIIISHEARDEEMANIFNNRFRSNGRFVVCGINSGIDFFGEKTNIMYARKILI